MSSHFLKTFVAISSLVFFALKMRADEPLSRADVAKLAKPGTVFVFSKTSSSSGFCVHPSGLFIAAGRAVTGNATTTVVIDAGLSTQRMLKAKVERRDKESDLVLLRAEGEEKFPALALAEDETLTELTETIILGFPSGKSKEISEISINAGNVTSLRRDAQGALFRIQLDTVGSPGGPVLDRNGKVVGVIANTILEPGVNIAIPVRYLKQLIARPDITLISPIIDEKNKHSALEFKVTSVDLIPNPLPLNLEIVFSNEDMPDRQFKMQSSNGIHTVNAVPFPASKGAKKVRLEIKFKDDLVRATAEDLKFKVGTTTVQLSELRKLRYGATAEASFQTGKPVEGALSGLDSLPIKIGGQSLELALANASQIVVFPSHPNTATCTVIAWREGKEVARQKTTLYPEGTISANLGSIRDGKFVAPAPAAQSTTYLRAVTDKSGSSGEVKTLSFEDSQLSARSKENSVVISAEGLQFEFAAPRNNKLRIGEYMNAIRYPPSGDAPGVVFNNSVRVCDKITGQFVIWELETQGGVVKKFAVDFFMRCDESTAPLYGKIRFHSTFD